MKKVISLFLSIVMLVSVVASADLSAYAEEDGYVYGIKTLTRAEWMHDLSLAFEMKDESGYLENYYSDLDATHKYYEDILLNNKYGTIDLEAGSNFYPDNEVTREFAVHTLNSLLGYQKESDYVFSDASLCNYPDDAQVAIELGWLELNGQNFSPNSNLNSSEAKTMIEFALNVNAESVVDENYDSNWDVASDVIEIPDGTQVTTADNIVTIYDSPKTIKTGDKFVVYNAGIGIGYIADSVTTSGNKTIISTNPLEIEDAFDSIDAEKVIDADDMQVFSETEGLEVSIEESDDISTYSSRGSVSKKFGKIKLKGKIDGGKISVDGYINNPKATFTYNTSSKKASIVFDGDLNIKTKFSGGASRSFSLAGFQIDGIGGASISIKAAVNGSYTSYINSHISFGVEFNNNQMRNIQAFKEKGGSYNQTQVDAKVGICAELGLNRNKFISGRIFAEMGFKADHISRTYTDGALPKNCVTDKSCFYIDYGAEASCVFTSKSISNVTHLFDYGSSPVQSFHHYEDGKEVASCKRGNDFRYYTRWDSAYWGMGFYNCSGYGLNDLGELVPVYTYSLNDNNEATITGYKGNSSYLNIPEQIDGYTVVAIGKNVFKNHTELSGVNIPDAVISIGNYAFQNTGLTSLTLPKNLRSLGYRILAGNTGVKEITIPKTLTESDFDTATGYPGAFGNSGIEKATFEKGITSIPGSIFSKSEKLREVNIPDTVTTIKTNSVSGAFMGCVSLTQINIPDSVTSIGNYAFKNSGLTSLTLPKNLRSLGYRILAGNTGVKEITIPKTLTESDFDTATDYPGAFGNSGIEKATFEKGITSIPGSIFSKSEKLREVNIPDTVTTIESNSVSGAFMGCVSLKQINIPDSVTSIGNYAFKNSGLTSLTLPKNLRNLGYRILAGNTGVKEITIPKTLTESDFDTATGYPGAFGNSGIEKATFEKGITSIPGSIFSKSEKLREVNIPDTVTTIKTNSVSGAFMGCVSLTQISIPDSVTSIGNYAFKNSGLTSINLPNSITGMGDGTFSGCSNLKTVKLPNTRKNISKDMFNGCTSLESIELPDTVQYIRQSAFEGSGLKTIKLPSKVELIEASAFKNSALESITFSGKETSIGNNAFQNCDNLKSISVPDSVSTIGTYMFQDCDTLTDVKLGIGITKIPQYAFEHCDLLAKIVVPYRVSTIENNTFSNCVSLADITIPRATTNISSSAFSYPEKVTIKGISGTYAETFANEQGMKFVNSEVNATNVSLNNASLTINKGKTAKLVMSVTPSNFTDEVSWKSTDTSVATVDDLGLVTAKGVGTATIKVTVGNVSANCKITVVQPVTSIYLNETDITLNAIDTYNLSADVNPDNAANKSVKWTTSNPDVATVDQNGKVTAVGKGNAQITVSSQDGSNISEVCNVTVSNNIYYIDDINRFESSHNYSNDCSDYWSYTIDNADHLNVTFDSRTNMEEGFDFLSIYDNDWNLVGKYTGSELADKTIFVKGDTVRIQLVSDNAGSEWGFKVTDVNSNAHTHTYQTTVVKPTCTEQGYTKYTCNECGDSYNDDYVETIPHSYVNGVCEMCNSKDPNYSYPTISVNETKTVNTTTAGEYTYYYFIPEESGYYYIESSGDYDTYGYLYDEDMNELAYNDDGDNRNFSMMVYLEKDKKYIIGCRLYNEDEIGTFTVSVNKHTHSYYSDTVEPTCTEEGYTTYTCNGCGYTYTETIAKKAHTYKKYTTKATTSKNGSVVTKCTACGEVKSKSTIYYPKTIKLSKTSYTYNGKVQTPTVTVKDSKGKTLKKNTDYTVTYAKGRKYVGKYSVKITFKGNYSGSKTLYFTIIPKATSISSVASKSKGFTVKWKKQTSQTTGYQIQYSTSSKFSSAKTVTVGSNKTTSKTISKLKAKKKYYVRVRTYKTVKVNGKSTKIYSSWSKAKAVTTKK